MESDPCRPMSLFEMDERNDDWSGDAGVYWAGGRMNGGTSAISQKQSATKRAEENKLDLKNPPKFAHRLRANLFACRCE